MDERWEVEIYGFVRLRWSHHLVGNERQSRRCVITKMYCFGIFEEKSKFDFLIIKTLI